MYSSPMISEDFLELVEHTDTILKYLLDNSFINDSHLTGTIIDIGFGTGGSSASLAAHGGRVLITDNCKSKIRWARGTCSDFENIEIFDLDGTAFLREQENNSVNLITAFMSEIHPISEFIEEARRVLASEGVIFITSDIERISDIRDELGIERGFFDVIKENFTLFYIESSKLPTKGVTPEIERMFDLDKRISSGNI